MREAGIRGSATLEFALMLPVLAIAGSGLVDYCWLFAQQNTIINAARQGAREGAVQSKDRVGTATDLASAVLEEGGIAGAVVTVDLDGDAIIVTVEAPWTPLVGILAGPDQIVETLVMRVEPAEEPS